MLRPPVFISAPLMGATPAETTLTALRVAWLGRCAIGAGMAPVIVQATMPLLFDDLGRLNLARARDWSDGLLATVAHHPAGRLWVLDTDTSDAHDRNSWRRLATHRGNCTRRGTWDYWLPLAGTDANLVRLHAVLEHLPPGAGAAGNGLHRAAP